MDPFGAIAESPVSAVVAGATVAIAMMREIAVASRNQRALDVVKATFLPFLALMAAFAIVAASRLAVAFR